MSLLVHEDDPTTSDGKAPFLPDVHLKSAILSDDKLLLIKYLQSPTTPCPKFISESARWLSQDILSYHDGKYLNIYSENFYWALLDPSSITSHMVGMMTPRLRRNKALISTFLRPMMGCSLKNIIPEQLRLNRHLDFCNNDLSLPCYQYFALRELWENIRDNMKMFQIRRKFNWVKYQPKRFKYQLMYNSNFAIISYFSYYYVFNYSQILMITDTINSRFLSILFCDISRMLGMTHNPEIEDLTDLYDWGANVLQQYGNNAYLIFKEFEAVCTGVAIRQYDSLPICRQFLDDLLTSFSNEQMRHSITLLVDLLQRFATKPTVLVEIYGCYRHFGHPTVDELGGVQAMLKHTRAEIIVNDDSAQRMTGAIKKSFITQFVIKNKRWPKCFLPPESSVNKSFRHLLQTQPTSFSSYGEVDNLLYWNAIRFEKEFDYNDFPDYTELLSDTSISPYKHNWLSVYHSDLLNIKIEKKIPESRRVLIEMLSRPEVDCKAIRETIQSGCVPESWFIVGLHSKERELKPEGRLFAMMVLEMRLLFNSSEKNLAEKFFKYLPIQTMTWSEADLMKAMLKMTNYCSSKEGTDTKRKGVVYVIVNLDFSRFNNRWRYESLKYLGQFFDDIYGVPNLYNFSHIFFENAYYFLSSQLKPPDIYKKTSAKERQKTVHIDETYQETEVSWDGQPGGCEGLRQKFWTAAIGGAILANEQQTKIKSTIIGQGDNQVLLLEIPMHIIDMTQSEYISNFPGLIESQLDQYLISLKDICAGIGMDLKLQETWMSTEVFNYGKEIIIGGNMMPTAIKKLSRAYSETSHTYPSISNRISSIYTAAFAATTKGYDPFTPYLCALLETVNLLDKEANYSSTLDIEIKHELTHRKVKLTDEIKLFYLMLPKQFGGYPITPFLEFLYRGHPDDLTSSLCWLRCLAPLGEMVFHLQEYICHATDMSQRIDYSMLILDPLSINWDNPITSSNIIKSTLLTNLQRIVKNNDIKRVFSLYTKSTHDKFIEYLMSIEPCFPRAQNEIYRLSPEGAKKNLLSTFTDMRTLKGMMSPDESNRLIYTLRDSDKTQFIHILELYFKLKDQAHVSGKFIDNPQSRKKLVRRRFSCTTRLAQFLRDFGWQREVTGVTTPHPIEQFYLHIHNRPDFDSVPCSYECITYILCDPKRSTNFQEEHVSHRGQIMPYLGSGTSEKRASASLPYPKTDRALKSAQQLYRMKDWLCDQSGTLQETIQSIIESRVGVGEDFLIMTSGVNYGGSAHHRLSDVMTKHAGRPNFRLNVLSNIYFSSDALGKYAGGQENYMIFFQGVFLHAQSALNNAVLLFQDEMSNRPMACHQHPGCTKCLKPILELPLFTDQEPPVIPSAKGCKILYSDIEDVSDRVSFDIINAEVYIEPMLADDITQEEASSALASVILGEISIHTSPHIVQISRVVLGESSLNSLTVGLFTNLSIDTFHRTLIKLWILDNYKYLLEMADQIDEDVAFVASTLILRYNDTVWDILKQFYCLPSIRDQLQENQSYLPDSSEAFITGKGLGHYINSILNDLIEPTLEGDHIFPPFFVSSTGFSLSRCIRSWVNGLVYIAGASDVSESLDMIRSLHSVLRDSTTDDSVNLTQFFIEYGSIQSEYPNLPDIRMEYPFRYSKRGAESWLIPSKIIPPNTITNPKLCFASDLGSIKRSKFFWITRVRQGFLKIGMASVLPIIPIPDNSQVHIGDNPDLYDNVDLRVLVSKDREDHMYRLNSKYSTAFLKYGCILASLGVHNIKASVHLAEGSGSVAKYCALVLGSKVIIYNSLFNIQESGSHRMINYMPSELVNLENYGVTVIGTKECIETGGDITNSNTQYVIKLLMAPVLQDITLLTCDAETSGSFDREQSLSLVRGCLKIYTGCEEGTLIIFKTFCRIPSILYSQVKFFLKLCHSVKLMIPPFSSHESYEIFITGYRLSPSERSNYTLDDSHYFTLKTIAQTRLSAKPFLSSKDNPILVNLFCSLDQSGFPFNVNYAIRGMLYNLVSISDLRVNPLMAISRSELKAYNLIKLRLGVTSKLRHQDDINRVLRAILINRKKESIELNLLSSVILNCHILRYLLWYKSPPIHLWQNPMTIWYKQIELYTLYPDYESWIKLNGRSYNKVLGSISLHDSSM